MRARVVVPFLVTALVLVWFFCFSGVAKAGEVTLTWANPDRTFTLVDAGPYTNPAGTKLYMEVADVSDPAAVTYTLPNMKPGTYKFVAVSYDDQGVSSPVSGTAEKVITEFVVVAVQAKIVAKLPSRFLLLTVGTVPLGTPCDPDTEVNGHHAVPIEAVTFTGAQDVLVVAQCG